MGKLGVVKKGINGFLQILFMIFYGIVIKLLSDNASAIDFIELTSCGDDIVNHLMNEVGKDLKSVEKMNSGAIAMAVIGALLDILLFIRGAKKWHDGTLVEEDSSEKYKNKVLDESAAEEKLKQDAEEIDEENHDAQTPPVEEIVQ
jgi:hypothetical protein